MSEDAEQLKGAGAVGSTRLVSRWTRYQQERADQIVNDIAEDIDNGESRIELRRALAIYADLLFDARTELGMRELHRISGLCKELEAAITANEKSKP